MFFDDSCPAAQEEMKGMEEGISHGNEQSRWRRWGGYALGILIESATVIAISLAALLLMFLIKAIMT